MPDPAVVGRALAALADPDATAQRQSYEYTIASAADAFSDIATAATFLDDDGEATLRRAVGAATRDGHPSARTGRTLLRDLTRVRESIAGPESSAPSASRPPSSGSPSSRPSASESPSSCPRSLDSLSAHGRDGDHFHSPRTTVFSGGGEPTDR
ncbi:hypothetical protein [Haloferax sp. DFSO52]|uniref:hypothetical protein n=1 Tax=Haloferax sp. DFSO52 TaxID=3388505 RepID=UPI003A835E6C